MNNKFLFIFLVLTAIILAVCFTAKGYYYPQHSSSYNNHNNQPPPCTKCGTQPPDCRTNSTAPEDGGPPCSCNNFIVLRGCTLKPCDPSTTDPGPCDCSQVAGGPKYCLKQRCKGADGACQTCDNGYPPGCTTSSANPDDGGAPCSCSPNRAPDGCTVKPCTSDFSARGTCICQPGVQTSFCLSARCPGSNSNTTANVESTSTTSSVHSPSIVNSLSSLLDLGHVSSDGNKKSGLLGNILGRH